MFPETIGGDKYRTMRIDKDFSRISYVKKVKPGDDTEYADNKEYVCKTVSDKYAHEFDILKDMDHDNIVKVHGQEKFEDSREIKFVMDKCTGGDLFNWAEHNIWLTWDKDKDFSALESTLAQFIGQVLSATAYMHSKNVIHFDLKPENVVIVDEERKDVKLIDFGSANKERPGVLPNGNVTPEYMAPECSSYIKTGVIAESFTKKVDMFSVGAMMYTLVTGEHIRDAKSNWTLKSVTLGKGWSHELQDLITSLVAESPGDRPDACAALDYQWFAQLAEAEDIQK